MEASSALAKTPSSVSAAKCRASVGASAASSCGIIRTGVWLAGCAVFAESPCTPTGAVASSAVITVSENGRHAPAEDAASVSAEAASVFDATGSARAAPAPSLDEAGRMPDAAATAVSFAPIPVAFRGPSTLAASFSMPPPLRGFAATAPLTPEGPATAAGAPETGAGSAARLTTVREGEAVSTAAGCKWRACSGVATAGDLPSVGVRRGAAVTAFGVRKSGCDLLSPVRFADENLAAAPKCMTLTDGAGLEPGVLVTAATEGGGEATRRPGAAN